MSSPRVELNDLAAKSHIKLISISSRVTKQHALKADSVFTMYTNFWLVGSTREEREIMHGHWNTIFWVLETLTQTQFSWALTCHLTVIVIIIITKAWHISCTEQRVDGRRKGMNKSLRRKPEHDKRSKNFLKLRSPKALCDSKGHFYGNTFKQTDSKSALKKGSEAYGSRWFIAESSKHESVKRRLIFGPSKHWIEYTKRENFRFIFERRIENTLTTTICLKWKKVLRRIFVHSLEKLNLKATKAIYFILILLFPFSHEHFIQLYTNSVSKLRKRWKRGSRVGILLRKFKKI